MERHQFIADIIDQHSLIPGDAFRERLENIVDPGKRGGGRTDGAADPTEAADVAEKDGGIHLAALEQAGTGFEFSGQLAREELLETQAHLSGDFCLLDPGQS